MPTKLHQLFGRFAPWKSSTFSYVNDSLRGGKSTTYIEVGSNGEYLLFEGNLDPSVLGAAFSSIRTFFTPEPAKEPLLDNKGLDLSDYDGLLIETLAGDGKRYSINLKNDIGDIIDQSSGKRESTIEYNYYFTPEVRGYHEVNMLGGDSNLNPPVNNLFYAKFEDFVPYYRGRPITDGIINGKKVPSLDPKKIQALSVMVASNFGKQKGNFYLGIESICAFKKY
ncbi:NADH:ubiquinone oxidoreductase complex I intermediate-associated protein 30 [Neoconidiobolus thromboides FSU 785]|nr:NADH:ubiquinone oxidoreductase complex I intermediate-associated protein 30 [Neoconidiobolus thromboides FSU 785]